MCHLVCMVLPLLTIMYHSVPQVGMGLPLYCIKDIRELYKQLPFSTSPIDFEKLDIVDIVVCLQTTKRAQLGTCTQIVAIFLPTSPPPAPPQSPCPTVM